METPAVAAVVEATGNMAIKLLTAADILSANDFKYEDVKCDEWGGTVRMRNLTAEARGQFIQRSMDIKREDDEYRAALEEAKKNDKPAPPRPENFDVEACLVVMSACDETGAPLFTNANLAALMRKSAAPIGRCASVAQRLSGLMPEAEDKAVKD